MHITLATGNHGKLLELKELLYPLGFTLTAQAEQGIDEVPETGLSFVENALIKARHAANKSSGPAIADDSGLCVDALGGSPGIYSARYAGPHANDSENNARLIRDLDGIENRTARFVCVLVYLRSADDPIPLIASSEWQGRIIDKAAGANGFGYDPHFYLDDLGCTSAQLPAEKKNAISHRGQACANLCSKLDSLILP
jgi:XTP/dITP diphosphohydrolase